MFTNDFCATPCRATAMPARCRVQCACLGALPLGALELDLGAGAWAALGKGRGVSWSLEMCPASVNSDSRNVNKAVMARSIRRIRLNNPVLQLPFALVHTAGRGSRATR